MTSLKNTAKQAIDAAQTSLKNINKLIYGNPELGFEEHYAHNILTEYFEQCNFSVERSFKLPTAFRAVYDNGIGPNLAVMCEYDALPNLGHACGHNLISEVGVATALGVKAALEEAEKPLGRLTVIGCPAEEDGGGKISLINAGVLDDVDAALMAHPSPHNILNPIMVANTTGIIKYHGKASHAAGFPWDGVNALDAAVQLYNNVSCLRQQMKPMWRVHGIIKNGGYRSNIIPDLTELEYTVRTPTDLELDVFYDKFIKCVESAAQSTGCTVEYEFSPRYSAMMSNVEMTSLYEANSISLGTVFNRDESVRQGGSTDMGNVSRVVPSIHPKFTIGTSAGAHSREFQIAAGAEAAHLSAITTAKALAMTMIDIYENPHYLTKMKQEFKDQLAKS